MFVPRPLRPATARAVRRSRKLVELLVLLLAEGPRTEVEAAVALRVSVHRLRCILVGDGRCHRPRIAAIPLGLVLRELGPRGVELHLTDLGLVEARLVLDAFAAGRRV